MSISFPINKDTFTRLAIGFTAERCSDYLGSEDIEKKILKLTERFDLSIGNIGDVIHALTPRCIADLALKIEENIKPGICEMTTRVEKMMGKRFANELFTPLIEESVFRIGFQTLFTSGLMSTFKVMGKCPKIGEVFLRHPKFFTTVAKIISVHMTAYLFAMTHKAINTGEGATRYSRALIRGVICELGGNRGIMETMVLHMAYNHLLKKP